MDHQDAWESGGEWSEHIARMCNEALLRLQQEDSQYAANVKRRAELSAHVDRMLQEKGDRPLSEAERSEIREYIEKIWDSGSMSEYTACYMQGFGDALRIVIETGALPNQR